MFSILPEGKPLWGGPCRKLDIEKEDVRLTGGNGSEKKNPEDPGAWENEISKVGAGGVFIFSDGSLLESGNVGGGAFVVGTNGKEQEVVCGIGSVATVWDDRTARGLQYSGPVITLRVQYGQQIGHCG